MKKMMFVLLLLLFGFIFYIDITQGTITQDIPVQTDIVEISSIEVMAKPGDTLLAMLKRHDLLPSSFNVDKLSREFSILNNGTVPHKIIAGEKYLLPIPK